MSGIYSQPAAVRRRAGGGWGGGGGGGVEVLEVTVRHAGTDSWMDPPAGSQVWGLSAKV